MTQQLNLQESMRALSETTARIERETDYKAFTEYTVDGDILKVTVSLYIEDEKRQSYSAYMQLIPPYVYDAPRRVRQDLHMFLLYEEIE